MLTDPLLIFLKCFATWLRIRILMGFTIAWCIILMSLSSWLSISEGGSFSSIAFPSGRSYKNWDSAVCSNSPYSYLSPFTFTYTSAEHGSSSSSTSCAWPKANSEFRLSLTVFAIVFLCVLFFKTPFSLVARVFLGSFAMLFFAIFVMDAASAITGRNFCNSNFENTTLSEDLASIGAEIECEYISYEVVIVLDLVTSGLFFLMHGSWALAKDLYVNKSGTSESKTLLGKK